MTDTGDCQPSGDRTEGNITGSHGVFAVGKDIVQEVRNCYFAPTKPQEFDQATLDAADARLAKMPLDDVPAVSSLPVGSGRLLPHNRNFTGRDDELKQLAAILKGGETAAIGQAAAATGMGGIGKSQLALEFAHRYGQFFLGGVAWISFADETALPNEVAVACTAFPGLPPHVGQLDLPEQVILIRRAWQSELPRLLVFDNCEREELLADWLPASGSRILVTSRQANIDWSLNLQLLPLESLPRSDSIRLLGGLMDDVSRGHATIPPDAELDAVAEALGDLPLALHMAGTYLGRYHNSMSVADYLAELQAANPLVHESLTRALGRAPTGHDLNVARTFLTSLERLDNQDEADALALALLARAAYFAPGEPIPPDLLRAALSPDGEEAIGERTFTDALQRLAGLGLLDLTDGTPTLHRLLAHFVQAAVEDEEAQSQVERVAMAEAYRQNMSGDPRLIRPWLGHVTFIAAAASARGDEDGASLLTNLGYHLQQSGDL